MTIVTLSDLETPAPALGAGESVSIEIPWKESGSLKYFDLLFACLAAERMKLAVKWEAFEAGGEACVLRGTVIESGALAVAVADLQSLRYGASSGTEIADEMQNLAFEMEGRWLDHEVCLPELFKATRIEQLLYFLQQEEMDHEQMRRCAQELVAIESSCGDLQIVKDNL